MLGGVPGLHGRRRASEKHAVAEDDERERTGVRRSGVRGVANADVLERGALPPR